MHRTGDTWTIARQIAFFPSTSGGKIHAARKITHTAVCGVSAELESAPWYHTAAGEASEKASPMVCKKCLRLSTTSGVSAIGIEQ